MVNFQKNLTVLGLLFLIFALTVVMCGKVPIKKRSLVTMEGERSRDGKDEKLRPSKRTFCNAFTGCQGKRSDLPPGGMKDYDYGHESPKEPMDDNSIDDVARDILAEARLWEAFQTRKSMLYPMMRRQGLYGREKRATYTNDDTLGLAAARDGLGQRSE